MARIPKTVEVAVIQGNYGYGWDDLVEFDKNQTKEIRQTFQEYRQNEHSFRHRIIHRRIPNTKLHN